eukprot:scaffold86072_cov17-Tisochrysis_lutea.AAC.1
MPHAHLLEQLPAASASMGMRLSTSPFNLNKPLQAPGVRLPSGHTFSPGAPPAGVAAPLRGGAAAVRGRGVGGRGGGRGTFGKGG